MRCALPLLFVTFAAMASAAAAQSLEMHVALSGGSPLFANGDVIYTDFWGNYSPIDMNVELWIRDSASTKIASSGLERVHTADYSLNVSGTGVPGQCYTSRLAASGADLGNEVGSSQVCLPDAPPPPPPPPADQNGGNTDWSGTGSPIILNLEPGSYRLSGLDDPVSFDITGDGHRDLIGWTARGSNLAFLALDRNANGTIDDGRELFGDATPRIDGTRAANGFEGLRDFDENRDGFIDAHDPIWQRLLLWIDDDHNGISDSAELVPIGSSSVRSVSLDYHAAARHDPSGNRYRFEALTTISNGRTTVVRPCYDVFFVVAK